MKVLVSFSGGKDSLASLIWAVNEFGNKNVEAVFCDTKWEHELTYAHIDDVVKRLQVKLTVLTSEKYDGFVDLAKQKKRFPSTKARFCTEELKSKPMINYVLKQEDDLLIIQGIRKDESLSRSLMEKQCTFFKYYFSPYGHGKDGKPKFHSYRKKEIVEWKKQYADDILRPVFDWTAQEVIDYILKNGLKPNPLYYMGFARVGCMPCIMSRHQEIKSMIQHLPDAVERLKEAQNQVGNSSFFPPGYIPDTFCTGFDKKSGKKFPILEDVLNYINRHKDQMDLFEDKNTDNRCMSFYGLCE